MGNPPMAVAIGGRSTSPNIGLVTFSSVGCAANGFSGSNEGNCSRLDFFLKAIQNSVESSCEMRDYLRLAEVNDQYHYDHGEDEQDDAQTG